MSVCMHQGGHKETCNACYRNLRAENARLQERVADKIAVIDVAAAAAVKLVRERDALQARVEEAERKWNLAVGDRDACLSELAKAEALAERRKEALEVLGSVGGIRQEWHLKRCLNGGHFNQQQVPCGCGDTRAAIEEEA